MRTLVILTLLFVNYTSSQVTLRVTNIPNNTPVGSSIYLIGSINGWNETNTQYLLQPDGMHLEVFCLTEHLPSQATRKASI
jgi:hypothetical protein